MEKRLYDKPEIAEYLCLSKDTISKWVQRDRIPFVKLGKSLRFDIIKINTWLKDNECAHIKRKYD